MFSDSKEIKILVIVGNTGTTIKKTKNNNGTITYSGYTWDLWQKIIPKFKNKYKFLYFYSDKTGDGSTNYNKFCELVNKGKYDMALGTFHHTSFRENIINFSTPINIDFTSVIHYPQSSIIDDIKLIMYPIVKLIVCLIIIGILFGIFLSYIDTDRTNLLKGNKYRMRVILTTISSMFGEMGYLTENASLTYKGIILVIVIMIISFILVMFTQGEITKILILENSGKITFKNVYTKKLIGFKGYASVEKIKRFNNNITTFEFKEKTNIDDTERLLKKYMDNTDKYDGVILSYCRAYPFLQKYPDLIYSNLGNEPCSFIVNKTKTTFLKELNSYVMILKQNLELKRICQSHYGTDQESSVCSLT